MASSSTSGAAGGGAGGVTSSRFQPLYDPINTNEPTSIDRRIDRTLAAYMNEHMPLETDEEMHRRNLVLTQVEEIFLKWVRRVATELLHMPEDDAVAAGGKLYISGSHKLGVREPKADIDTVCVAPNFCTREHFFTSLKSEFMNHPSVTEFTAVETALVPLMSFDFEGVSIDLLFARLSDNIVPENLDILDDNVLTGLDDATEKSLNGPRVTMMIGELVKHNFETFLIVLRCVRRWAKKKGLYGNKLGYLGGVNCNLLVAFVCQLYPKASPSTLLTRFFQVYSTWQWPKPVMLNKVKQNPSSALGRERVVWSAEMYPHHAMPIITPAYPAMNSTEKVSKHTLAIMQQEFSQSHAIIKAIIAERGRDFNIDWGRLFEPSDFFIRHSHYLGCHVIGAGNDADSRSWIGFVESRVLGYTRYLENLPLKHPLHFYPVVSKTNKSSNSICYFIGFDVDKQAFVGKSDKNIYIDEATQRFQMVLYDPERGWRGKRGDDLSFAVEHFSFAKLPRSVFDALGGRDAAKAKRAELLQLQKDKADAAAAVAIAAGASDDVAANANGTTTTTGNAGNANNNVTMSGMKRGSGEEVSAMKKQRPRSDSVNSTNDNNNSSNSNNGSSTVSKPKAYVPRQPIVVLRKPQLPFATKPAVVVTHASIQFLPQTTH